MPFPTRSFFHPIHLIVLLCACSDAPAIVETDPSLPAGQNASGTAPDDRSITVWTGETATVSYEAGGEQLARLSGGCDGKSSMSIGFQSGELYQPSWRYFAFDSASDVAVRQTGEIPLSRVVFDDGVKDEAEFGTYPPNRYAGTGTLIITRHEAGTHAKLMEGIVRAEVESPDGDIVPLEAKFSIPLACWSVGLE